ncbi:MAG: sugar phosphate isomerase/epimerase [Akkermansiaceae bacterium]|nr:sugar phosphate isomerase/epimerase [Armatimonadota bacterium]
MTPIATTPRVSVSTWALHPLLGTTYPGRPGDPSTHMIGSAPGTLDLLDVPGNLAKRGIKTMELCHFHLPLDSTYREEFRAAVRESGVELWSVLIDDGDIVHPEHGERDSDFVRSWLDVAGMLGSRCVRVIGGKQAPTVETLSLARDRFRALALEGYLRGVRVMTENWFPTLHAPDSINILFAELGDVIGLCFDFGNWDSREDKYDALRQIARYAESSHAKCRFDADGLMDETDWRHCLDILARAGYSGPYTLVASDPNDTWGGIERQAEFLRENRYTLDEIS